MNDYTMRDRYRDHKQRNHMRRFDHNCGRCVELRAETHKERLNNLACRQFETLLRQKEQRA
jgi:hypothetical protein